jgi:hypothetical protein
MSVPAEMEFAAMLVPSWATVKAAAMMKTPKRWPEPLFSFRKLSRRRRGFQIGSPKMTVEDGDQLG